MSIILAIEFGLGRSQVPRTQEKYTRELDYGERNLSKYSPIRSTGLQLGPRRRRSGVWENTDRIG